MMDVTSEVEIVVGSSPDRKGSLIDNSTETFWSGANNDDEKSSIKIILKNPISQLGGGMRFAVRISISRQKFFHFRI
jgi:hypothetical protein